MSGAALRVRSVGWSSALTAEYVGAEAPSAEACNSALVEVVLIADRLLSGDAAMSADRASWVVPTTVSGTGETIPEVGRALTEADRSGALRGTDDRTVMVLALAQVGRELGASSAGGLRWRSSGWVQVVAAAVGVAALVGLAVDWYCANRSRADQSTRVRQAGIVEAGRLQSERIRVAAETHSPIAPPGPVELAAAETIRAAADQARAAGIGQTIAETASNLGKLAFGIALLWAGVSVFSSKRGG